MSHIFISYSRQDIEFARYLRALLEQEGFAVWIDEGRLTPSARWWKTIEQNIDGCGAFVVVMSPNAAESDWVEREILRAERRKKSIYPVLLAGDSWSRLANIQHENLSKGLRAKLSQRFVNSLREAIGPLEPISVEYAIVPGDITQVTSDVVALKYTQKHHGSARVIANLLVEQGSVATIAVTPEIGGHSLVETTGLIRPQKALFVGLPAIRRLGYEGIRNFSASVLGILAREFPETKHLTMTIHGSGAGLDEAEALLSQFAGFMDAIRARQLPLKLERISIVEHNVERVKRLQAAMEQHLADANYAALMETEWGYRLSAAQDTVARIKTAGVQAEERPFAYVAMTVNQDTDDIFYYGIQGATHALGLLCVRIDKEKLTEDVLDKVKERIEAATVVIAELSTPDPTVYLQLGYAWAKNRPVILLARNPQTLQFETQACLRYHSINGLERALLDALNDLKARGWRT